jgi:uncharacterized protein
LLQKSRDKGPSYRFLADRMLGTLCRYLRFMGYDTASANSIPPGNTREDTVLLERASSEGRVLLTRDRDLARRGGNAVVLVREGNVLRQVQQLVDLGIVDPELRMNRCSLCNEPLRAAHRKEISEAGYAPGNSPEELAFFWCRHCRRLYWMGSHGEALRDRLKKELKVPDHTGFRQV